MPFRYTCSGCGLDVQLGGHHLHDFTEGYEGGTLLMCGACGAQHQVTFALRPEQVEAVRRSGDRVQVVLTAPGADPIRTMAAVRTLLRCSMADAKAMTHATPAVLGSHVSVSEGESLVKELQATGAQVTLIVERRAAPAEVIEQAQDTLEVASDPGRPNEWVRCIVVGPRQGAAGEFDLEKQPCARCGATGTLVSDLPEEASECPRCHKGQLRPAGGWVT